MKFSKQKRSHVNMFRELDDVMAPLAAANSTAAGCLALRQRYIFCNACNYIEAVVKDACFNILPFI